MELEQDIENRIRTALPDADVQMLGEGCSLTAVVVSPSFSGKNRVQRHRMVNEALGDAFATKLHALQIKTKAPEEL